LRKAIVTGMIATYPIGGVVWDYGQYALGLEELGFDVYYLEDTGWQTYDPRSGQYGDDCAYGVAYLAEALSNLSPILGRRWHFRSMDGRSFGMAEQDLRKIMAGADIFLNVSGGTLLRDEYMACPRKVLIDTDPGWNHFRNYPVQDAFACLKRGDREHARRLLDTVGAEPQWADLDTWWKTSANWHGTYGYRAHDLFFTYAEQIGRPRCTLPTLGIDWLVTRPPVILNRWRPEPPGNVWTTVMTWKNFPELIQHGGVRYGTKEMEFDKIERLPAAIAATFELAVGGAPPPVDRWKSLGWDVVDARARSRTADEYRSYIERSRGEVSVAKNIYVATRSGWFSCRSVCYLAAGRPVAVQDTGFSDTIPVGSGLLAFSTFEEALHAVESVEQDYEGHSSAAHEIARDCFDANLVLGDLLRQTGL
jgi:hypothetical protein